MGSFPGPEASSALPVAGINLKEVDVALKLRIS